MLLLGGRDPDGLSEDFSACDVLTVQGDRTSYHIPHIPVWCRYAKVVTVDNTVYVLGCGRNRMYKLLEGCQWQRCADMERGVRGFSVAATGTHILCVGGEDTNLDTTNLM